MVQVRTALIFFEGLFTQIGHMLESELMIIGDW